jgi:hypothetical protein
VIAEEPIAAGSKQLNGRRMAEAEASRVSRVTRGALVFSASTM